MSEIKKKEKIEKNNVGKSKSYRDKLNLLEYEIIGTSVAGRCTNIIIPQLKVTFDAGMFSEESINLCDTYMISHGHMDHIGCLDTILNVKSKSMKSRVILPKINADSLRQKVWASYCMDNGLDIAIVSEEQKDNYLANITIEYCEDYIQNVGELQKGYYFRCFKTDHIVPSFGYIICKKKTKLKDEYAQLEPKAKKEAIMEAKKNKLEINDEIESVELVFTGDTTISPILSNPDITNSRILITELTEVDSDTNPEPFHKFGHIHMKDIIDNQDKFNNNYIVFSHFASKYKKDEIEQLFEKQNIDEGFRSKCRLLLEGF